MGVVWITGASRGIGFATAQKFLSEGWKVVVLTRDIEKLDGLKKAYPDHLHACKVDLMNLGDVQLPNYPVDILINNAGALVNKPLSEVSLADLHKSYGVNVFGPYLLIQKLLPQFSEKAHIVNISSVGGIQGSVKFAGLSAYSSAKGAINVLTECLQTEYEQSTHWSFNALALGAIQTEMLNEAFPGLQAPLKPEQLSPFIYAFATSAHHVMRGKVVPVSMSTP
ncbi:MAG: SDR family oxidoreductase [Bacteroidetes bacterium]|nr:SDR family oxidoreductase [Bacteroidota bacterium]